MTLIEPQQVQKPPIFLGTHLRRTYQYVLPMENTVEAQGKSTTQDQLGWQITESLELFQMI